MSLPSSLRRGLEPFRVAPQLAAGVAALSGWLLLLALASVLQTHDPQAGDLSLRFAPAGTANHWLGTDNLGRDLWSRVLSGLPWSVGVASVSCLIALLLGGTLGMCAAQFQGWPRAIINQLVDATLSFPGLVAAIIIVAVAGRGFWPLSVTLGLLSWPVFARVVHAESLRLLAQDYVTAARVIGSVHAAHPAGPCPARSQASALRSAYLPFRRYAGGRERALFPGPGSAAGRTHLGCAAAGIP